MDSRLNPVAEVRSGDRERLQFYRSLAQAILGERIFHSERDGAMFIYLCQLIKRQIGAACSAIISDNPVSGERRD